MNSKNCLNCLCNDSKTNQCAHGEFLREVTPEMLSSPNDCVRFESIAAFLSERGWHPWYNDNYWINKKCVTDNTRQDYTMYGLSLQDAYTYEVEKLPPVPVPRYHFRGIAIQ
jgi:hypothetical protein